MMRTTIGIFLFACLSTVAALARDGIRIVGTDLLGAEFSKAVYAAAARHGVSVALAFDGSRPGMDVLKAGRADLALVILPEEESGVLSEFHSEPLAYHSVVVLVPAACPVQRISLPQLAAIFGGRGAAPVNTWGDLDATGEWSASPIAAAAPVSGAGVALEYFRHAVLAGSELKGNVARYQNADDLRARFAGESRAIALAAKTPDDATIRALAVGAKPVGAAFLPTPAALHAGDYPLRLTLRLVARREQLVRLRVLVDWLRSEEAARAFERAGVVPLPAGARASAG